MFCPGRLFSTQVSSQLAGIVSFAASRIPALQPIIVKLRQIGTMGSLSSKSPSSSIKPFQKVLLRLQIMVKVALVLRAECHHHCRHCHDNHRLCCRPLAIAKSPALTEDYEIQTLVCWIQQIQTEKILPKSGLLLHSHR